MGFLQYIGLGSLTHFTFSSLHLFTTLGWACWPFYFFSLNLLCWASLIGLYFVSLPLGFSNIHFTPLEELLITHLYSQPYSSRRASYYTTTKRGPWAYLWTLFVILKILFFFRLSLGPYLCIGRFLSLFSCSNPFLGAFLGFSPHGLLDANLQKWVSTTF